MRLFKFCLFSLLIVSCGTEDFSTKLSSSIPQKKPSKTFTIASYNVDNFFDQVDDAKNQDYGDYRIKPNSQGQYSNYGDPVKFLGKVASFTDVKALNIRQVMKGIKKNGPEIIAMQEVESERSFNCFFDKVRDLGYIAGVFSGSLDVNPPYAVGTAILSKFPITSSVLLHIASSDLDEELRPILKETINISGKPLVVYVNHWKSKAGPESLRMRIATVLESDIGRELDKNPYFDYVILGDLNSAYNEIEIIDKPHNDTNGKTGINSVLKAQDDKSLLFDTDPAKYNLNYELPASARRTEFSFQHGWSSLDHMIIGNGMVDKKGIAYRDLSFKIGNAQNAGLKFLFNPNKTPKAWIVKGSGKHYVHSVGGYSDHVPIFAEFVVY